MERDDFDARLMPAEGYPLDNLFCLVGTNPENYTAALGLSSKVTGARSDGLVQIDNAYVEGAHRAMVHRSHSGRYGIVNSEEGYQNLRRFLFGDLKITVDLVDLEVPGTADDYVVWQLETALSIRGLPVLVHEQRTAHHCPVQIECRRAADSVDTPVPLLTTFLSSRALGPTDRAGRPLPLRHALTLRAPAAWAVWNSALPASIRDWTPDEAYALVDIDPQPGRWRGVHPATGGGA